MEKTKEIKKDVTKADVSEFVKRLETWGEKLPQQERVLLGLLLRRATTKEVAKREHLRLPSIKRAATEALRPIVKGGVVAGTDWADVAGAPLLAKKI